jgi:hypothetical protein
LRLKMAARDAAGVDIHPGQLAVALRTVRELVDAQKVRVLLAASTDTGRPSG